MQAIQRESTITCPICGHRDRMTMAAGRSLAVGKCPVCGAKLTPGPGQCCVACAYGTVPCPPVQRARAVESQAQGAG